MSNEENMIMAMTADIAAAHMSHNTVAISDVPKLIGDIHGALLACKVPAAEPEPEFTPAVPVRGSVKPDHIISLINGKPYKMLKRHLAIHGLTPEEYRARYGLPADYPMTAANYAETRRQLAKSIGLGTAANRNGGAVAH